MAPPRPSPRRPSSPTPLLTPFNPQPTVTQVQPTIFPVPQFGTPAFSGAVAYFSDAAGADGSAADFTATIDWGDGTALSAGTISAGPTGSPVGTYTVSGSHTYAEQGTYPVEVFIVDTGGSRLTVANTATVTALPLVVTGAIDRPATAVCPPATPTSPTSSSRPSPAPSSPPFPRGRRRPKQTRGSPSRPRSTAS